MKEKMTNGMNDSGVTEAALLETTIAIALRAHQGQKDKAGAVYILHPLRVMLHMETPLEMMAAVLHDVAEDSGISIEQLRAEGIPEAALTAIEHLTHREGESYDAFISRVKKNNLAVKVKRADLEDNMDMRRIPQPSPSDLKRLEKYRRALQILAAG